MPKRALWLALSFAVAAALDSLLAREFRWAGLAFLSAAAGLVAGHFLARPEPPSR